MIFSRYQQEIETELKAVIGINPSPFYQMMRYHMGWIDELGNVSSNPTGKLLRPSLCLLSCDAVGGVWQKALPAAAMLELIHNFSLIHDDIEDQSEYRRHRKTIWSIWGEAHAINVGDGMYALSRLSMLRLSKNGYPTERILNAINLMDEACLRLCEGQYLDIANEKKNDISLEKYMEMISGKTAALMGCSVKVGALLGTDDSALVETMYNFGLNLGLAFQIIDDLLGIWGKEEITGKSTSDILKKKKTIPVIHALQTIDDRDRNDLLSVYNKELITGQDIQIAMNILNKARAYEYTKRLARDYYSKSLMYLDSTRLTEENKARLKEIAEFLIEREY